jgi:hypothetical protein
MQAIGIAYAQAFLDANCDRSWAYEACRWVAAQEPGFLLLEFAKGKTLLNLSPIPEESRLVVPYLKPGASRKHRLMVAQLDLEKCYERVLERAAELCPPEAREGLRQMREEVRRMAAERASREEKKAGAVPLEMKKER